MKTQARPALLEQAQHVVVVLGDLVGARLAAPDHAQARVVDPLRDLARAAIVDEEVVVVKLDTLRPGLFDQVANVAQHALRRKAAPALVVDLRDRAEVAAEGAAEAGMIGDAPRRQALDHERLERDQVIGKGREIIEVAERGAARVLGGDAARFVPEPGRAGEVLAARQPLDHVEEHPFALAADHVVGERAHHGLGGVHRRVVAAPHQRQLGAQRAQLAGGDDGAIDLMAGEAGDADDVGAGRGAREPTFVVGRGELVQHLDWVARGDQRRRDREDRVGDGARLAGRRAGVNQHDARLPLRRAPNPSLNACVPPAAVASPSPVNDPARRQAPASPSFPAEAASTRSIWLTVAVMNSNKGGRIGPDLLGPPG